MTQVNNIAQCAICDREVPKLGTVSLLCDRCKTVLLVERTAGTERIAPTTPTALSSREVEPQKINQRDRPSFPPSLRKGQSHPRTNTRKAPQP